MTIQKQFADHVVEKVRDDQNVVGLAVAGSWLTNEMDEFSDLDLILVTREKTGGDKVKMLNYARGFGHFLSGFTGEHVGEPRVLICLYDNPDYQWIEDRFWIWVHYALLKIGRGEYMEAIDFFSFLRMVVFGPLLHIKNKSLPRGVRKVETKLAPEDLQQLKKTLPTYSRAELLDSLQHSVTLYRQLRQELFTSQLTLQLDTEEKVMEYFQQIKQSDDGQVNVIIGFKGRPEA